MIIALIIKFFDAILKFLVDSLPVFDTSAAFRYFASVCRYLYALDGVFPVSSALLPILILTSVIGLFMLGYRIVIFILNLVRGAGIK